ncbi:MAG: nucleotidyltransferase domain-containing protein [Oscillospiraceae bacterium]|nr:nucleotidyltransferase domain-containing protein [Oscillospiraceae bacterium]
MNTLNNDLWMLSERAKELECIYAVDEALQNRDQAIPALMRELVRVIPGGFAYPENCRVSICLNGDIYEHDDFAKAVLINETPLEIGSEAIGCIRAGYITPLAGDAQCAALEHEEKLLAAIGGRVCFLALSAQRELSVLFDTLQNINPEMLLRICEKLRIFLPGVEDAGRENISYGEINAPTGKPAAEDPVELMRRMISGAAAFLPGAKVSELIAKWVAEERAFSLVDRVDSPDAGIGQILEAVRRYANTVIGRAADSITETWLVSELCHRFLTGGEELVDVVMESCKISDFESMIERIIGSEKSGGNIGGKGSGIFIASRILSHMAEHDPLLADIKVPKTWYIAADQIVDFLRFNHMEDMRAYKYNSAQHLRMSYGNVVKKIKNGKLPPHITKALRILLDDIGEAPIIVRSSSLLEDSMASAFSGKYKSLFLANTGTKERRLDGLCDAVLEVYSSMYNPDAIIYRRERGLLNFAEQMGILIQEVVGKRIGPYFMPVFAGVAFSENQLRWTGRISRSDGLARIVAGLGTRAVDRVSDDYPTLFAPAKPGLRINQQPDEAIYYSQKHIDLINTEKGCFETLPLYGFLREYGHLVPGIEKLVSVHSEGMLMRKNAFNLNTKKDSTVLTFDGILSDTQIPATLMRMLTVLSEKMKVPIDMEFAYDGEHIYLLQCRAQGLGRLTNLPAPIPQQLPAQDILFTANRYITNGLLDEITHIVYVDADGYNNLSTLDELYDIGKAVGALGALLPRRKYILIGPGRWGSRGDIKLGVRVTYSDICNAAALVEVAKEKYGYVPELSFGTHFFQDLAESDILYIPLYPDSPGAVFKSGFFFSAENLLGDILPQYSQYDDVIKVIDVPAAAAGKRLSVRMNSDLEQAAAFFTAENTGIQPLSNEKKGAHTPRGQDGYSRWMHYMAQQIAREMDIDALCVKAVYLTGSVNTGTAGIGSDIDLIVHFTGDEAQRQALTNWLDGWSKALAQSHFLQTGFKAQDILDVHIITDESIRKKDSYAAKIDCITDPASLLRGI